MKLIKTILTAVMAIVTSTSCSSNTNNTVASNSQVAVTDSTKTLVVYFSKRGVNYKQGMLDKGNTEVVAEYIKEKTGADVFRIIPDKDYEKETDYDKLVEMTKTEHEKNERPTFKGKIKDIDQYDVIIIGSPIWWYTYPQVVYTFLEHYNLNGKTIVPFTTHEGSGMADVVDVLKKYYPKATIAEGIAIKGRDARNSKDKVTKWLNKIGY